MAMPHPLSLTDLQINTVMRAATQVPYRWRTRFLESVVDHLWPNDSVSDEAVFEAVRTVARRMHANVEL